MWLLPPDFPLRPLRLAPDRRALPWYATEHEIEQLMELLRRMVPEIKEWVRVPWAALERVGASSGVRDGAALVALAPKELDEAGVRAIIGEARWPYVFWRPVAPSEEHGAWLEREVKRALLSELRQGLASEQHPLHGQGIERLPVDLAAAATDDPLDLLAIVQGAVSHRLEHANEGTRVEDWTYSVRRAVGEQLAMRLGRVERQELKGVLTLMLSGGQRRQADDEAAKAGQRLQEIGLALRVGDDVALGPLARSANDPVVHGVLLERLPTADWPGDGRSFLRLALHQSNEGTPLPPTRIAGPMVIHYPKIVLDAFASLEEVAGELPEGRDTALALLRAAWIRPLFLNQLNVPGLRLPDDEQARNLRLLDQPRFGHERHRAFVRLLRALHDTSFAEATLDVDAHLRRLEDHAKRFDESFGRTRRRYGITPGVELFGAIVLLGTGRDRLRLQQLGNHLDSKYRLARRHGQREAGEEKSWLGLKAEAYRLTGRSALAARLHQIANFSHPELFPEGHQWRSWNLARAIREAGYDARAHEILIVLRAGNRRRELLPLKPEVLLELGHIELERGSLAKARRYYREVGEQGARPPPRRALYAEVYDAVARLIEGTTSELEPRLAEIAREANELGDPRLSLLADLVLGDLLLLTHRFDGARRAYSAARQTAEQVGDMLATACAFEKLARLEEALGRGQEALAALLSGSELDTATEHHVDAERQLRRAVELAEQTGLSDQADELRARALEQQRAAELHEVDNFTLAKRAETESEKASAASPSATEAGEELVTSIERSPEEPASDDHTPE